VQDQKKHVVIGADPEQARAQQRRAVELEGSERRLRGVELRLFEQERLGAGTCDRRARSQILDGEE
jgi:hypothetical protein